MDNYHHLLSKHKILISFNIAKRIKPSQIKSIRKKLESKFTDPTVIEKEISKEIKRKTKMFLNDNEITGLIHNNDYHKTGIYINKKVQVKILNLANKVAAYCNNNKFTKEHVIFFVQALLHLLKISNDDMQQFKQKYNINQEPPDDYLDEDDIDEDEEEE
jgi:hypothetical protein